MGALYIPSLEEYARIKRINSNYNSIEVLSCEDCRYCRASVNACIYGNKVRNLEYMHSCPRTGS